MTETQQPSVYEQIGEIGFTRLVAIFYREVATEPILKRLYPDKDMTGAERRLRLFLIQYFGGPWAYAQERGHPRLRMRHAPFPIGQAERNAWMKAMQTALDETQIPEPAYTEMREYFEKGATFMINTDGNTDGD